MILTMLGTGHAVVTECYNTCFTLQDGGRTLLVDGGGGSGLLVQLKRAGIAWSDVESMFVTHKHTDHLLGIVWMIRLYCSALARRALDRGATIYANEDVISALRCISEQLLGAKELSCLDNGLKLAVVADGEEREVIGHRMQFFDIHSTKTSQMGFVLDLDSDGGSASVRGPLGERRLCCCGDEPYNEACEAYVRSSEWLLHEAFCLHSQAEMFRPYEKHHSTARDAAQVAHRLGVRNLVLYHTEDQMLDRRKELYTREARQHFSGNVYVPDDLEVIDLGTGC